ncbi:unnamed protein product [Rotaria socialis]|nr:unnamed protein product [Rotaria socialis]CAF3604907.1 unnamed protein product [Rotaria socialis]CAF4376363.1 unnamed protein product [Rotaria socialis]
MAASIGNTSLVPLLAENYTQLEIQKFAIKLKFIFLFVQAFICLFGLFGNVLALIVINKKSLRNTSSSVFITYMAIFDSAVLFLHAANLLRPRRQLFIHCSLIYLTDVFTFCANWVLVIITLERCIAVASPLLAKRFCSVNSARYSVYILVTIAIISFSTAFPIVYNIRGDPIKKKCTIRKDFQLALRIVQPIIMLGIPDILLLSNFFTVYSLIRRRLQHSSNDEKLQMRVSDVNSNRKQQQLTIMLVTVNLAFYLFTTPAMIIYILEITPPNHRILYKLKRSHIISNMSVVLLQLNNATNFIFYCLSGQRFRRGTVETFNNGSVKLKFFYYRYILCDKQYRLPIDRQSISLSYSTTATRASFPTAHIHTVKRKFTM